MKVGWAFLQTLTSQVFQSVASIVTGVLIARALGPAGQGVYAVFAAGVGLGVVAASIGQFEGNVIASAGQQAAGRILLVRSLGQCILTGLLVALTDGLWTRALPLPVRWIGLFFACVLALEVLAALIRGINLGQHHILAYNLTTLMQRFCYLAMVSGFALGGFLTLKRILTGWAVAVGISVSLAATWIWLRSPPVSITTQSVLKGWAGSIVAGLRPWVTIVLSLILVRCDAWMLGPMLGVAAVGQVSVASALAEYLWYVPSILGNVLFAKVAADRGPLAVQSICRACRAMVTVLVPVVVTLLLAGRWMVPFIYGQPFFLAGKAFVVMLPGMTALALYLIFDSYFAGIGFPPISIYAVGGALVLKVGLNFALVPSYGVIGAAAATSLAYVSLFLFKLMAFSRSARVAVSSVLKPRRTDFRDNLAAAREWVKRRALVTH
jgi:O-antigen/teichoic acid export membrane protein